MIPNLNHLGKEHPRIAVAVSGGADSMCLLHLCATQLMSQLVAVHINHQIRPEAHQDTQLVQAFCDQLKIPLESFVIDVPKLAKQQKISMELAGRQARYQVFSDFVKRGYTVLTAHTAGDNIETLLYNLTRQSGLGGMCGIPPQREGFVRPLLHTTRQEIENYCQSHSIAYVIDSTNLSDDYTRNFLRHQVVPKLLQINPKAIENAAVTADNLRCDQAFLNSLVPTQLVVDGHMDAKAAAKLPMPLQSRLIAHYLKQQNLWVSSANIDGIKQLLAGRCSSFCASGGSELIISGGQLQKKAQNMPPCPTTHITFGEWVPFLQKEICFFVAKEANVKKLDFFIALDYDKIIGKLFMRSRRVGDSISLANRGVSKTLKKYYNEVGIPPHMRGAQPVLCDDLGVVAVLGHCVAQRVQVSSQTTTLLIGEVKSR